MKALFRWVQPGFIQRLGIVLLVLGVGIVMGHPDGAPPNIAPDGLLSLARVLIGVGAGLSLLDLIWRATHR